MENLIKYFVMFTSGMLLSLVLLTFTLPKNPNVNVIENYEYTVYNMEEKESLSIEEFYKTTYCNNLNYRKILIKLNWITHVGIYCDKNLILLLNSDNEKIINNRIDQNYNPFRGGIR